MAVFQENIIYGPGTLNFISFSCAIKYYSLIDFYFFWQPFKNIRTTLSLQAELKQASDWSLPAAFLEANVLIVNLFKTGLTTTPVCLWWVASLGELWQCRILGLRNQNILPVFQISHMCNKVLKLFMLNLASSFSDSLSFERS